MHNSRATRQLALGLLFVGTIGSSFEPAMADRESDEKTAIGLYSSKRYSEAAALLKSIRGAYAPDFYYLGLCLIQLHQPALAADYFWKAYTNNAEQVAPDPQIALLSQQALSKVAWCKALHLKNNQAQSFKVQGRDGKVLVDGQFAYGSNGLSGKIDSFLSYKLGRIVGPGVVTDKIQYSPVDFKDDGAKSSCTGGGVSLYLNQKPVIGRGVDLDAVMRGQKGVEDDKNAPKLVICFSKNLNKDGSYTVYLTAYPGTTLASAQ